MTDIITEAQLRVIAPNAGVRLTPIMPHINDWLKNGAITTPQQVTAFFGQVLEECGEFRYMEEIADGSEYEGREDLGNTQPGDGRRFKGRGLIDVTGRANYGALSKWAGTDFVSHPELVATPQYAVASAVWFWTRAKDCDMSLLANMDWFKLITRWVNGGYNGFNDRLRYWHAARGVFGLPYVDTDNETKSIMAFQKAMKIDVDGSVGPQTIAKLKQINIVPEAPQMTHWWKL